VKLSQGQAGSSGSPGKQESAAKEVA